MDNSVLSWLIGNSQQTETCRDQVADTRTDGYLFSISRNISRSLRHISFEGGHGPLSIPGPSHTSSWRPPLLSPGLCPRWRVEFRRGETTNDRRALRSTAPLHYFLPRQPARQAFASPSSGRRRSKLIYDAWLEWKPRSRARSLREGGRPLVPCRLVLHLDGPAARLPASFAHIRRRRRIRSSASAAASGRISASTTEQLRASIGI